MSGITYHNARQTCLRHADRLRWAMGELHPHRPFVADTLSQLSDVEVGICDQSAHDYPDDPEIQASLFNKAMKMAEALLEILEEADGFALKLLQSGDY